MLNLCVFIFTLYALGGIVGMLIKTPYTRSRRSKKH